MAQWGEFWYPIYRQLSTLQRQMIWRSTNPIANPIATKMTGAGKSQQVFGLHTVSSASELWEMPRSFLMLPWPVKMVSLWKPTRWSWLALVTKELSTIHILWFKLGDLFFHPPDQSFFHIENHFVWISTHIFCTCLMILSCVTGSEKSDNCYVFTISLS